MRCVQSEEVLVVATSPAIAKKVFIDVSFDHATELTVAPWLAAVAWCKLIQTFIKAIDRNRERRW